MKWGDVAARAGRNDLPALLATAVFIDRNLTDEDQIRKGVRDAWTMPEWPLATLGPDIWGMLFGRVLELGSEWLDDEANKRPSSELPEAVTLWRGATHEHRAGMSWTSDRDKAAWFATRFTGTRMQPAKLYEITAAPHMVFARFDHRGESEWVLDPEMILEDDPCEVAISG